MGRTPSHAVGRGSGPSTPQAVSGGSFKIPLSPRSNPVPRSPRAYRIVRYRPTAHGASDAVRTWRGCVVGQHAAHSSPRRRPRHDPTDYATGRRRKLRNILINMFDSHGARPTHVRYRPTRRARATQSGLTAVVVWPNALRAPPHAGGRVSTPPKARLIGGRGSEMSCSLRLNTVARDPRAYYPV